MIIGAGGVGLMGVTLVKKMGAKEIVIVDIDAGETRGRAKGRRDQGDRRQRGRRGAADPGRDRRRRLGRWSTSSARRATVEPRGDSLIKGGTVVVVGLYGGDVTVPTPYLPMRAMTLRGSYVGSQTEMAELLDLVKRTGMPPVPIRTRPLEDVNDALERPARRQDRRPRGADAGGVIPPMKGKTPPGRLRPIRLRRPPSPLAGGMNGRRVIMDATALRAMQAPIKERYKGDPGAAMITLKAKGTLDDQQHRLQGRDRPRARGRRPASGDRRLGARAVLGRHAARGAGRLRRRDAESGLDRARYSAEIRPRLGRRRSRFPRHARRRQGRAGRLCADPPHASTSIPTRRRRSSISC